MYKKHKTRGFKTVVNRMWDVFCHGSFDERLKQIRDNYGLAKDGVSKKGHDLYDIASGSIPITIEPYVHLDAGSQVEVGTTIHSEMRMLCNEHGLFHICYVDLAILFLYFNNIRRNELYKIAEKLISVEEYTLDVCELAYKRHEVNDAIWWSAARTTLSEFDENGIFENNSFCDDINSFPVVLKIGRSASVNQIIDYVRKYKNEIKELQSKEYRGEPLIKSRVKFATLKYDFIWSNREIKPAKLLASVVNKKFHTNHDEIYIRNILSKLKKQRDKHNP